MEKISELNTFQAKIFDDIFQIVDQIKVQGVPLTLAWNYKESLFNLIKIQIHYNYRSRLIKFLG